MSQTNSHTRFAMTKQSALGLLEPLPFLLQPPNVLAARPVRPRYAFAFFASSRPDTTSEPLPTRLPHRLDSVRGVPVGSPSSQSPSLSQSLSPWSQEGEVTLRVQGPGLQQGREDEPLPR